MSSIELEREAAPMGELERAARRYVALIDGAEAMSLPTLLQEAAVLLARLQAGMQALGRPAAVERDGRVPDFEHRFELFLRLRALLGEHDAYWLEGDREHMSGSLADDLADIYFDLRQALALVDAGEPERALRFLRSSYVLHWGQHLVDAARHIYRLHSEGRLGGA
ncbi:DUF5063 domain-containing protein [Inmirania thermothiophila]|uniref:Uncharacterized protein DUF5063 n=1 Tax=Inmirania thermothiophila TaxID=1750597 RepID=A0A3N1Y7P3_9GAMM|nr:DUF5063 domain-containing protein [Inmirania thermothiophila]ROR34795.1 uncharacterized protein DUF5063 [Inmirania thermothiophila]